jgi:hypothetical protein
VPHLRKPLYSIRRLLALLRSDEQLSTGIDFSWLFSRLFSFSLLCHSHNWVDIIPEMGKSLDCGDVYVCSSCRFRAWRYRYPSWVVR